MKAGAVAMIDGLGFRGIWDRYPPTEVMTNMHELKRRVESDLQQIGAQPEMQFDVTFLSDTIVLGLSLSPSIPNHIALSAIYVIDIVSRILAYSARHAQSRYSAHGGPTLCPRNTGPLQLRRTS